MEVSLKRCLLDYTLYCFTITYTETINDTFHALIPIHWLADEDSLMCCIVMMGRQIAQMFYIHFLYKDLCFSCREKSSTSGGGWPLNH